MDWYRVISLLFILPVLIHSQSTQRRCYVCRSRGERGDCRDPFIAPEQRLPGIPAPQHGDPIHELPCSSGWCSKVLDGADKNTIEDYDLATERACLVRGPSDGQERCAYVFVESQHKEVFMCMCKGDLCNTSAPLHHSTTLLLPLLASVLVTLAWL